MSGDVQPRKRKDKKRKKDELGVEEPRGTAAVLGEGDVFMHSQHEHGTGGHWCAKVIFFSLLAVLVTLIGLIILENRGISELEANSVESRYSGVLEGWLEDAPDDDHHDEHTLELLKHHDDDDDHDQGNEVSQEDDHDEHDDETDEVDHVHEDESGQDDEDEIDHDDADLENDEEDETNDADEEQDENDDDDDNDQGQGEDDNSEEQQLEEANEDEDDDDEFGYGNNESEEDNDEDDDDIRKVDEHDNAEDDDDDDDYLQNDSADNESTEKDGDDGDDDKNSLHSQEDEENDNDDEEQEEHEEEGDSEIEVEKLEKEVSDEEALSEEQPTQAAEDDSDKSQEFSAEIPYEEEEGVEDEDFLEAEIDEPLPFVERVIAPKGKPLAEVEDDETTTVKPADTLAEEEEYEKRQEELRNEQAQASHVWLKLAVGGALLVATHAVVSRVVAPRDDTPASEGHASREDTPSLTDRRMTLISEETAPTAIDVKEEIEKSIEEKVFENLSSHIQSVSHPYKEESEEEEEDDFLVNIKDVTAEEPTIDVDTEDKELYSDEEEIEEDVKEIEKKKNEAAVRAFSAPEKVVEPEPEDQEEDEDVPDDVEIIDDEQLEEELEEEDDEEEISDVDDAELLSRLEAKYGRLPEPERPGQKHKDGGNSIDADWPGEPSDKYWRKQLDNAEEELRQGDWSAASERVSAAQLQASVRARWILARAIDASAEAKRDNRLLTRAITAYLDVLKLNERLSDVRLREIADRTLDRIKFRGNYLSAEPVYRLLIRRFPDVIDYRNNLTVSYLMANRADLAEDVIKETLKKWPDDRFALAHHGFILKTQHNRLEEAVEAFQKALEGDTGSATEPRFYYHLGDSLLLLGRFEEAHEVHKRGAKLGHFLSPSQRSLYNVERLKSRPWWDIEQTPYLKLARALEKSWKEILKEGLAAQSLYEKEKEGLKERGEWSQLDLFVRGQEVPGRCKRAPVTCSIVRSEAAAAGCRRGQIKFSAMEASTHVRPHVGPTNCRLRMHLGLSNTKDTYLRVDQETRQWQVGKVLMFDDSFEHEVWHNGTGSRLVLIVDVWHPALTPKERRTLAPI